MTDVTNTETAISVSSAFFKSAPPIAVSGMTIVGYSISDWVLLLTLVYTVAQLAFLIYDRFKKTNAKSRNTKKIT